MISRIPPLSSRETLQFYHDGILPERFKDCESERRRRILEPYIRETNPEAQHIHDCLLAGGFISDEE